LSFISEASLGRDKEKIEGTMMSIPKGEKKNIQKR
jgi:hypothetical protein